MTQTQAYTPTRPLPVRTHAQWPKVPRRDYHIKALKRSSRILLATVAYEEAVSLANRQDDLEDIASKTADRLNVVYVWAEETGTEINFY